MEYLPKNYKSEKATLCSNNNCVTVYGETAEMINTLAVLASIIVLGALIAKALR